MEPNKPKTLGGYTLTLLEVALDEKSTAAMSSHSEAALNALPETRISALISVKYGDSETFVKPAILQERNRGMFSEPVAIPGPAGGQKVILRFVPPPSEREIGEAMAASRSAVDDAKKAGAPGSEAFRTALTQNPAFLQGRQMQDLADFKSLRFETFGAPDPGETVYISVGTKPLIWMVWLGTLLFSAGGFVAYRRRASELS